MMIDDIKKVLALCVDSICDDCPYADTKDCYNQIKLDARDLIIKQESEIERLHQEVRDTDKMARNIIEQYKNGYNKAFERLKAQQQEIDGLKAENEELTKVVSSKVYDLIDNAKEIADAREAWEKQAKIDVLNELKDKMFEREYMGVKYKERIFYESEINDMIADVQNGEDKS